MTRAWKGTVLVGLKVRCRSGCHGRDLNEFNERRLGFEGLLMAADEDSIGDNGGRSGCDDTTDAKSESDPEE